MKFSPGLRLAVFVLALPAAAGAQVDYDGEHPWSQRAERGPDAQVHGWWYNLGRTGMRVELLPESPRQLLVQHVFAGSPADGVVVPGDLLTGAGGAAFVEAHQDGYGMEVFGARGPIGEFAVALEAAQSATGALAVRLERGEQSLQVSLPVGTEYGAFGADYPFDCPKSERIRAELLDELVATQGANGSWGSPPQDTFAALALLTSDEPAHRAAALRSVRFHAANTDAQGAAGGLVNWRYMAAGIVLAEAYLLTGESSLLDELREVRDFLLSTQYVERAQIVPESYRSHPGSQPTDDVGATGGWGHNPGFEGYGPIAMLTGQGALVFALMARCGIEVPRARLEAAYAFLRRGTGRNGYLWYADQVAHDAHWADLGRTGACALAHYLSPYPDPEARAFARRQTALMGEHPESFPDTHGSPPMGMAYAAAGLAFDRPNLRRLMDANRYWFALAQCTDGTYYYQPNRDNAGYGGDARVVASAVTAFIFSIPQQNLAVTGRP